MKFQAHNQCAHDSACKADMRRERLCVSRNLHSTDVAGRRLGMTTEMRYDEGLEEIWRIKREIASEYPTLEDYFKGMMDYQEELRHQGVKFVRLPPREPEPEMA